jgi:hypothetical protein
MNSDALENPRIAFGRGFEFIDLLDDEVRSVS